MRTGRTGTIWLTGLSGAGKSTIAQAIHRLLVADGRPSYVLDGDEIRLGLNRDLGFSDADRQENVRRIGEVAALMADAGLVVVVPVISPFRSGRDAARARHESLGLAFVEVHVATPVEVCARRDPKGLYARQRAGTLHGLTGVDAPYEPPAPADIRVTHEDGLPEDVARIILAHYLIQP